MKGRHFYYDLAGLYSTKTYSNYFKVQSGARYANGNQVTPNSLTSVSAYIQQDDLFIGSLTVKEHLTFQALVRMDKDIPYKERMKRVETVAKEVKIRFISNNWFED